ncbi:MAG: SOS response-associated peptidase [Planctomycetes bacterium]|nr:SOS response-associated peptidase [Planctomycetota bacterium]
MCGRYALMSSVELLVELFGLTDAPTLVPRYNIAPTQLAPVIRLVGGDRRNLDMLKWGLIPSWATEPGIGGRLINARSETAATKPSFRDAMRHRRCLVPADGFYEWKKTETGKQPYWIHARDGRPQVMAGLWEKWWGRDSEAIESFTILTTESNDLLRPLHDRMPVFLSDDDLDHWLDPAAEPASLAAMLEPPDAALLEVTAVSRHVNNAKHDDPACVEPVDLATGEVNDDAADDQGLLFE